MSLTEIQNRLSEKIKETASEQFAVDLALIATEVPPKIELGDLAFPVAFELAKRIKQATGEKKTPREIAESLKTDLETVDFVDHVDVAGAGYLNVFIRRADFVFDNASAKPLPSLAGSLSKTAEKVCVEH